MRILNPSQRMLLARSIWLGILDLREGYSALIGSGSPYDLTFARPQAYGYEPLDIDNWTLTDLLLDLALKEEELFDWEADSQYTDLRRAINSYKAAKRSGEFPRAAVLAFCSGSDAEARLYEAKMPFKVRRAITILREFELCEQSMALAPVSPLHRSPATSSIETKAVCLLWSNISFDADDDDAIRARFNILETDEADRLQSARHAELAAAEYYSRLGCDVEDVSRQQLAPSDKEWTLYDLLVNEKPIDVKNARYATGAGSYYVEHCIPRFKSSRRFNADVTICGVISEGKSCSNSDQNLYPKYQDGRVTILGELCGSSIARKVDWMKIRFEEEIDFGRVGAFRFWPGWMFDYPPQHYPKRQVAMEAVDGIIALVRKGEMSKSLIPTWMLIYCSEADYAWSTTHCAPDQLSLLKDLRSLHQQVDLGRRSLTLFALGLAAETLRRQGGREILHQLLETLKFEAAGNRERELVGLQDPLNYFANMISLLCGLIDAMSASELQVKFLRMTHPLILRAVLSDYEMTLLAYCGGLSLDGERRCGVSPLVYGTNLSCEACRYLICNSCGFCRANCGAMAERRSAMSRLSGEKGAWSE